jgi:drug/metabolite transporter (DMT)-like permease
MLALAIACALFAAASNAMASVLQRRVARDSPPDRTHGLGLIRRVIRRPRWLVGIGCLTAGFLLQATALSFGGLALVQPLLAAELPLTLVLAALVSRAALDRGGWIAVALVTAGLALLLASAAPTPGKREPDGRTWLIAAAAAVAMICALTLAGARRRDGMRAGLLGVASGLGFALTAAFMTTVAKRFGSGPASVFETWQIYAMVAAGVCSLLLLQYALQSGSLAIAQPALTITDPVASVVLGVTLFGDRIRLGGWVAAEAVGIGLIVLGTARLAASRAWRTHLAADDREPAAL